MQCSKFIRFLMLTTASLALGDGIALAASAAATDTSPSAGVEEIVVTARLRKEKLQDVPVAVSVFTEKTIRDAGIERPADFIALTPNVTLVNSESVGNVAISIRGIGEIRNGETPVAVSVDGVLEANSYQFNQNLFDISQIEVLKGPQGALYGRNAIAGAIVITTKKPSNNFTGRAIVGYGNGDSRKAQVAVSGPLVKDKLLFRADYSYQQANGWITNSYLDKKVDNFRNEAANARLLYIPSDNLTLDLRLHHSSSTGGAAYFGHTSALNIYPNIPITTADQVTNTIVNPSSNNLGSNDRKLTDVALKIDYTADFGTLTSISSFSQVDMLVTYDGYDYSSNQKCLELTAPLYTFYNCPNPQITLGGLNGGTPYYTAAFNTTFQETHNKDYSQELRFTSPANRRFRYIAGAYFLASNKNLTTATQADKGFGIIPVLDFDPATPNQTLSYFSEVDHNRAYAVFGQADYDITKELELALDLRYDSDHRHQMDPRPNPYRVDGFGLPITASPDRSATFSKLQPKVSLTYKPTEDATFYASYAEGFRSGGFNAPGTEVNPFTGDPIADSIYKKETSKNYEVGFKTQFLDRRVSLNGALFYTDARNLQLFNFNGAVNAQIVSNIDKVRIMGGELEADAKISNWFNVYGSLGYTDSKIRADAGNPGAVGNQVPYNTKFKTTLGAQVHAPVSDGVNFVARIDWQHLGKTYFNEGGNTSNGLGVLIRNPLNLFNGRLGIETDSGWGVTLWGKNLTNKKYYEEVVIADYNYLAQPRTFGVEIAKSF